MQVINGDRARMPDTERRVIEWLRADTGPGIAVSGVHLPGRGGGRGGEADLVLFTPAGPVVIEVKGLVRRVPDAVLHTRANSRWSVDAITGDPIHVADGDVSPFDQAAARMFDLKSALGKTSRIDCAVLVVAYPGTTLRVRQHGPTPYGLAILAGNGPADLLDWLHTRKVRRQAWTAEQVTAALDALGVAAPPVQELAAAGFAVADPAAVNLPALAAVPAQQPAARRWRPRMPRLRRPRRSVRRRPARRGRRKTLRGQLVGLGAALLVMTGAILVLVSIGSAFDTTTISPDTTPPATTTPAHVPGPGPEFVPPPPPPASVGCYPFQPDC